MEDEKEFRHGNPDKHSFRRRFVFENQNMGISLHNGRNELDLPYLSTSFAEFSEDAPETKGPRGT